jgi:uncharacterized protein YgiM (DUF1202 family)
VTKLETALWALVLALLGAGVGLAVFRPWQHPVPASLSASQTGQISGSPSTRLVSPSAGNTCPNVAAHKTEQPRTIPRSAWVHASDGVNVRAAPSSSATRLTTLAVGTELAIQSEQSNPDGTTWYRIRLSDGRDGWLSGRFTTNYPISVASTDSLKIWLPDGYQFRTLAQGTAEARYDGAPMALLYVQSGARDQAPIQPAVPAALPRPATWVEHSSQQTLVGDLPGTDHVFGITLAGGCTALVHQVRIATSTRYYDFLFLLDETTSSIVGQLLDSASVQ